MSLLAVQTAEKILSNILGYHQVRQDYSSEKYHFFYAEVPLQAGLTTYEVRIDRTPSSDGQYHVQSRLKGSVDWHYADSVPNDEIATCAVCSLDYHENDVNMVDHSIDVCIYCEPEYKEE